MRLLAHEFRNQLRLYFRSRELAFFGFLFPVLMLLLLGSVYGDTEVEGVRGSRYLLAGMLGFGVVATAFAGLAIVLVLRREAGTLKRLRATPLPAGVYLAALIGTFVVVFAIQAAVLVALARLAFGVPLPDRAGSLVVVLLAGVLAFAALGTALSAAVRSAEGASAVVSAVYLPMVFISGAFFSPSSWPAALRAIADVLPLTYFIRVVKGVLLGGDHVWSQPGSLAVVLGWGAAGALVAWRTFRWSPREG